MWVRWAVAGVSDVWASNKYRGDITIRSCQTWEDLGMIQEE